MTPERHTGTTNNHPMDINDWIDMLTSTCLSYADALPAYRESLLYETQERAENTIVHINYWQPGEQYKKRKRYNRVCMRIGDITDILDTVESLRQSGHTSQEIKDTIISGKADLLSALNARLNDFVDKYGEKRVICGNGGQRERAMIISNTLYISRKITNTDMLENILRDFRIMESIKCRLDVVYYLERSQNAGAPSPQPSRDAVRLH